VPRSEQIFANRNKIAILDKKQQDAMRKVCRLTREVLDIAAREIRPGVTTDYIDEVAHKATIERNVGFYGYIPVQSVVANNSLGISFPSELSKLPEIRLYFC
jgi:methionine aminopeptidase